MTRDEARFALQGPLGEHFGHKVPEGVDDAWLDCWVALGMLKLDEPKSVDRRIYDALKASFGIFTSDEERNSLKAQLDARGLKIVGK